MLAPMAGVTDRPFRQLCRKFGAALAVSEMTSSDSRLWSSQKSQWRMNHQGEEAPVSVQIVGTVPEIMAHAAQKNVALGAHIIDINMGCPAKKVCNIYSGSALMKQEKLVSKILEAVVKSVNVPVTLKMRTGWDESHKNALSIAKLAESIGISALFIHGRTRTCKYHGAIEYDTIKTVKQNVRIPVIANGDIINPETAKAVLNYTKADGLMIGRAAQAKPWIFNEINYYLTHHHKKDPLSSVEQFDILIQHVTNLHQFYGEYMGLRIARKHLNWYCRGHQANTLWQHINRVDSADIQLDILQQYRNKQCIIK